MAVSETQVQDPELFLRMRDLRLVARSLVEGALHGGHRSPFKGFGAEFDSHREYQPGDDLRYLNWNLFARHGRLFTKIFHAERNLDLYLLLDATGSMGTRCGPVSKYRYAAAAAAALAYLARKNRDSAGLFLLRDRLDTALPSSSRSSQFDDLLALLDSTNPHGSADIGDSIDDAISLCRRRGIVVVFTDFFDKEERLLRSLRTLRARGHDVLVFQILDPWECELPASGDFEFADLESDARLRTAVAEVRDRYARSVVDWRADLGRKIQSSGVGWCSATTQQPLMPLIEHFLSRHAGTALVR